MKKWYKSHLDQLKTAEKKSAAQKTSGHSFDTKNKAKKAFPNPVLASKLKRSKTDSR